MYQVLYRKYRPKIFDEICGQEHITSVLKNEICAGRISHAFLFTGTRGTGKTSCAKILAKAVNCTSPVNGNPCGECESCRKIEDGSAFDIVEIDAASNNGVDNIRELREESNYTPASAKYRVYIIDEVHMLSQGAFNALLKTLEEPPEHVIFILATTEAHKIPATILSRCQRFNFRRITPEDCSKRLRFVADKEGLKLSDDAAVLISRLSDGAMRDALSLLDQCVGADNEITVKTVADAAGLADKDYLFRLSECVLNRDAVSALQTVDRLHNDACDMERLCDELITHFRNLMVTRAAQNPERLIVCTADELEKYKSVSSHMTLPQILGALDVFQEALINIKKGAERRTEVEMALLKLVSPENYAGRQSVLTSSSKTESFAASDEGGSLKQPLEKEAHKMSESVKLSTPQEESEEIPLPEYTGEPSAYEPEAQKNTDGKIAQWSEIVRIISSKNRLLGAQLRESSAYLKGSYVLIDSHIEQFRELINNDPSCKELVKSVISEVLGKPYKIGPYKHKENTDKFSLFVEQHRRDFD